MTMRDGAHPHDRLLELLADRAVGPLSTEEASELDALLETVGAHEAESMNAGVLEAESIELAAAAADLALAPEPDEPMPVALRARLLERIGEMGGDSPVRIEVRSVEDTRPLGRLADARRNQQGIAGRIGWIVAMAACLALVGVTATLLRTRGANDTLPVATLEGFDRFVSTVGVKTAQWSDWENPERAGVEGSVAWSEAQQTGLMRFEGLPIGEPANEQYQLWIIDERGLGTRVSGAIFDADSTGATVVRIEPAIPIRNAAAFAITIEQRGGVWVSDMSRRVVIASLGG